MGCGGDSIGSNGTGYTSMRDGALPGEGVAKPVSAATQTHIEPVLHSVPVERASQESRKKQEGGLRKAKAPKQAGNAKDGEGSQATAKKQGQSKVEGERGHNTMAVGERRDDTGTIPVALRDMPLTEWVKIEARVGPRAREKLEKGSRAGAKQGPAGVFGAVDVALPLSPPILQYPLNSGSGQAQKNIVGLRRLSKSSREGRKCIVYGMGIAEESDFEQMMAASGCETHAFDCTVDYEAPAVYKKRFVFHQ